MLYFIRRICRPAFLLLIIVVLPGLTFSATAPEQKTVNILTWWGYLDHPEIIASAEKSCGVKISHDDYYTNDEFLRRWNEQQDNYDILIFSETIYDSIAARMPTVKSSLQDEVRDYNPIIKQHFLGKKYPGNIVYFAHAVTGFLWKPNEMSISVNDTASEIFRKAKGRVVILIDDPMEIKKFLEDWLNHHETMAIDKVIRSFNNLKNLTQSADLYPTNNFLSINEKMHPAFTYAWSGEAINTMNEDKVNQYDFIIQPEISHITSDLLAQVSKSEKASCVANYLTSKVVMAELQNKHFYFTPYLDHKNISNPFFSKMYQKFDEMLPILPWIAAINSVDLKRLNLAWSLEKVRLRSGNA